MKSGGYTYHRPQMMDNSNRSILRNNDQEESSSKRLEIDNIRHLINYTCSSKSTREQQSSEYQNTIVKRAIQYTTLKRPM
jgi:hypothetical protein